MLISAGLDAIKVDIKGGPEAYRLCAGDEDAAWETARIAQERGLHVEIVNLLVPGLIDFRRVIERHLELLGEDVPLHFTRYFPAHRYTRPPTPLEVIREAVETARSRGLKYVYGGNLPGHMFEDTLCPSCGRTVISRGHDVQIHLRHGRCPGCGTRIHGVGLNWMEERGAEA
jgi:pyruvate formate lyase activating enzyme